MSSPTLPNELKYTASHEWLRIDGPMLPIEFARVSSGDRLTLVLVDTVPLQPTLWALSRKATLGETVSDLAKREGTNDSNIGRWPCTNTVGIFEKHLVSILAE